MPTQPAAVMPVAVKALPTPVPVPASSVKNSIAAQTGSIVAAPSPVAATVPPPASKGGVVDIISADSPDTGIGNDITLPALNLSPDKSELVKLDREAASVILGNPNHLSILADNSKTLILVPRAPGATYFTVLDSKGAVIMQRHVIVAGPNDKYVRIRRSCNSAAGAGCQTTQVYYCPDMCHEIIMGGELDKTASAQPVVPNNSSVPLPVVDPNTGKPTTGPPPAKASTTDSNTQ